MEKISFSDFQKIDLKVAKILQAEKVEGSHKLLKLTISLGNTEKTIIAGIGEYYSPENLINKEIVVVANLESKTIKGIESQGMLLAATDQEGKISLLIPDQYIEPGSKIS